MNLATAYLSKPSTQRILSKKPGQEGFSLIELVVVIAVLAVLTAIALPNLLGISDDAAARSAQQAVITAFKECQVHKARGVTGSSAAFESAPVNDFDVSAIPNTQTSVNAAIPTSGTPAVAAVNLLYFDATTGAMNNFAAIPKQAAKFPKFMIASSGAKSCTSGANVAATQRTYNTGCSETGSTTASTYGTGSGSWK